MAGQDYRAPQLYKPSTNGVKPVRSSHPNSFDTGWNDHPTVLERFMVDHENNPLYPTAERPFSLYSHSNCAFSLNTGSSCVDTCAIGSADIPSIPTFPEKVLSTPSSIDSRESYIDITPARSQPIQMKRFRLTSLHTRMLMAEFLHHPHPDAAQRLRLAQSIPGLSPRQVQVWFQNR